MCVFASVRALRTHDHIICSSSARARLRRARRARRNRIPLASGRGVRCTYVCACACAQMIFTFGARAHRGSKPERVRRRLRRCNGRLHMYLCKQPQRRQISACLLRCELQSDFKLNGWLLLLASVRRNGIPQTQPGCAVLACRTPRREGPTGKNTLADRQHAEMRMFSVEQLASCVLL